MSSSADALGLSRLHRFRLHEPGTDGLKTLGQRAQQGANLDGPGDREFERSMIKERVRAGLARAKAAGTKLGRPSLPKQKEDAIRAALSQPGRPGVRKIAAQFGIDPSTVQRISRPASESEATTPASFK